MNKLYYSTVVLLCINDSLITAQQLSYRNKRPRYSSVYDYQMFVHYKDHLYENRTNDMADGKTKCQNNRRKLVLGLFCY